MTNDETTEKLKGSAKEVAGQVVGDEDLEEEGQQQQEKARKREEAEAKKAEAAEAEKQAQGHEGRESANQ